MPSPHPASQTPPGAWAQLQDWGREAPGGWLVARGAASRLVLDEGRGGVRRGSPARARHWLSLLLLGSPWSWGGAGNPAQLGSLLVPSAWGLQAAVLSQLLRYSQNKARWRAGPGVPVRSEGERAVGRAELPAQCAAAATGLGGAGGSLGCMAGWTPPVPAAGCRARRGARGTHSTVLPARAQAPVGICRPTQGTGQQATGPSSVTPCRGWQLQLCPPVPPSHNAASQNEPQILCARGTGAPEQGSQACAMYLSSARGRKGGQ